jgi:hypothetical protein
VVAAGVLGLLPAAYTLVYALLLFSAVSASRGHAVVGAVFLGISGLAAAAAGAVQTLTGRGGRLLVAGGAAFAALTALGLVAALSSGGAGLWPAVLVTVGVAVVVLPNRPASRAYFAAVRDRR